MRSTITQPANKPAHSVAAFQAAFHNDSALSGAGLPFIYLGIKSVTLACGMSVAKTYAEIKAGRFPAGDLIGAQSRRWKSTDIAAWLNEQAEKAAAREDELGKPLKEKAAKATKAKKGGCHEPQ